METFQCHSVDVRDIYHQQLNLWLVSCVITTQSVSGNINNLMDAGAPPTERQTAHTCRRVHHGLAHAV